MTTRTKGRLDRSVGIWVGAALKKMGVKGLKLRWKWNPRLTSTIGRAHFTRFRDFFGVGEDWWMPTYIEFSVPLFERATINQRRETVYHEVAHAIDGYMGTYNPRRHHGKSWKELMTLAGVPATRCHDVPVFRRRQNR